jgi:ribokinase
MTSNKCLSGESTRPSIVVVGGINTDYIVIGGPRAPIPETLAGRCFLEAAGGKGANQAVAAARLGAEVALIGRVGPDSRARLLLCALRSERIELAHLAQDPEVVSGVVLVHVDDDGRKLGFAFPGANRRLDRQAVRAAANQIAEASFVMAQLEIPLECVFEAAELARSKGSRFLLDPAPPVELPDSLLRLVDILRANASEACVLTGIRVEDRAGARRAAERLRHRGVRNVSIEAGDEGDLMVWNDGEHWLPRLPVKTVDRSGAGDAFTAALAVALAEGRSPAEAGRFANAAAALTTTRLGAQPALPSRAELERFLAQRTAPERPILTM